MSSDQKQRFDLEERTQLFSRSVRLFIKEMPKLFENVEDLKQLLRSSGSVAANYIEANESISKKDFSYRIKICRKEAKESRFWLHSLLLDGHPLYNSQQKLEQEAYELECIFGSIVRKTS